jgi:hypothetical protein
MKPLSRPVGPSFVTDYDRRMTSCKPGSGTSYNAAMGRVQEVVAQYGPSLRVFGRRSRVPINYVIWLVTDGIYIDHVLIATIFSLISYCVVR